MSGQTLSAIAGVVLSLAFSYVPGLKGWFDKFNPQQKQGVMAIVLLAVTLAVFGLSCADIVGAVSCDKGGAIALVESLIAALVANQSTYSLSKYLAGKPAAQ